MIFVAKFISSEARDVSTLMFSFYNFPDWFYILNSFQAFARLTFDDRSREQF